MTRFRPLLPAVLCFALGTAAAQPSDIAWQASATPPLGVDARIQLQLRESSDTGAGASVSRPFPLATLTGLDSRQLLADRPGPVSFTLVREAGRLQCEGVAGNARGSGRCGFAPDAGFADRLAALGAGRPSSRQQYLIAVQDTGTPLLEALRSAGYRQPDVAGLVRLALHRVTPEYVAGLARAGYRLDDPSGLVALRIHGIDPRYAAGMKRLGLSDGPLGADELVALRIHRVSPEYVQELAALGYRDLSPTTLRRMGVHQVTPGFIRYFASIGYHDLSPERLVQMRIHGGLPRRADVPAAQPVEPVARPRTRLARAADGAPRR